MYFKRIHYYREPLGDFLFAATYAALDPNTQLFFPNTFVYFRGLAIPPEYIQIATFNPSSTPPAADDQQQETPPAEPQEIIVLSPVSEPAETSVDMEGLAQTLLSGRDVSEE